VSFWFREYVTFLWRGGGPESCSKRTQRVQALPARCAMTSRPTLAGRDSRPLVTGLASFDSAASRSTGCTSFAAQLLAGHYQPRIREGRRVGPSGWFAST